MKDIDLKKECEIENFDYSSCWNEDEENRIKQTLNELPKRSFRKGLNGKYLKKKNHIGKKQLRMSWNNNKINND